MSCRFTVTFNGDLKAVFNLAKVEASKLNGILQGDAERGHFEVKASFGEFKGNYFVEGNQVTFDLQKKPFLLPCALIKYELEKQIEKYGREQKERIV